MIKIAIVANTPPPYRVPVFSILGRTPGIDLLVIFCSKREPNRFWNLPAMDFPHKFLKDRLVTVKDRYIHNQPEVVLALKEFAPDIVVTDGFNPTHLYAFAYAWVRGLLHVPMTDGTDVSERVLGKVHRAVRRFVFARSQAFVAASMGGDRLYAEYGIAADRRFESCLCIDNAAFTPPPRTEKKFDFIFCGRIEHAKSPLFALKVAAESAARLQRKVSILFVGSGSEEESTKLAAEKYSGSVDAHFHGFATQQQLPSLYHSARIFLFPTLADVWGVVANEACAAGLPVIVSPHAGVVDELVMDGENGYVCEMDAAEWAERACELLTNEALYHRFSDRSLALVTRYSFQNSASGLRDACRAAMAPASMKPKPAIREWRHWGILKFANTFNMREVFAGIAIFASSVLAIATMVDF